MRRKALNYFINYNIINFNKVEVINKEGKLMIESGFEDFLSTETTITSKDKAVKTRMSKARAVEKMLGENLDSVVSNDEKMYNALLLINANLNNKNGAYSNALRKYYIFKNGREFPRISSYENSLNR
jgi:hypothetical protein